MNIFRLLSRYPGIDLDEHLAADVNSVMQCVAKNLVATKLYRNQRSAQSGRKLDIGIQQSSTNKRLFELNIKFV